MPIEAPRRISLEATRLLQEMYQEEFGEALSDGEAQIAGVRLLSFFAILAQSNGSNATPSR